MVIKTNMHTKKMNIYKKIDLLLWFLWGFSCLFIVPYVKISSITIQFMECFSFLVFISLLFQICLHKSFDKRKGVNISLFIVLLLYAIAVFWPIGGVITVYQLGYVPSLSTFLVPFARLFIIVTLFLAYIYYDINEWIIREKALVKGFIWGCIITVIWMIVEQIMFIIFHIPINKLIFQDIFNLEVQHTFINILGRGFLGIPVDLYRASGFSWDPGMVAPLVVLGWLTYSLQPEFFMGKHRLWLSCFLLLSLPLSLSRTALLGAVLICLIVFLFEFLGCFVGFSFKYKTNKSMCYVPYFSFFFIKSIILAIILTIALISIIFAHKGLHISVFTKGMFKLVSDVFFDQSAGTQRHLIYFKLIPHALAISIPSFLFGYGAMNVGVSMEKIGIGVLPGIESLINSWNGNWNPESMTVTFALMGGIVTLLTLFICVGLCMVISCIKYLKRPWNKQYLSYFIILLAPFILGMGYGIDNHIIFIIVFLMIIHICDDNLRYI